MKEIPKPVIEEEQGGSEGAGFDFVSQNSNSKPLKKLGRPLGAHPSLKDDLIELDESG